MNTLLDWFSSLLTTAINSMDNTISKATEVLSDSGGMFASRWDDILSLSNYLKPFCLTLLGICCLLELLNLSERLDMIKWEHGLRLGVKICLAKLCIDVAPVFFRACYSQCQSWVLMIGGGSSDVGRDALTMAQELSQSLQGSGIIFVLGMILSNLIMILAIWLCGLIITVIAYGRIFELYCYLFISPLPCAFFPLAGGNGLASRITTDFLKDFAAICLQGVMMMAVLKLYQIVLGGAIGDALGAIDTAEGAIAISNLLYTMLLGCITLVMSLFKCGSWSKRILGLGG